MRQSGKNLEKRVRLIPAGRAAAVVILLTLALTLPVLALDPRCETQPERHACQTEDQDPTTTTTMHPGTTTTAPSTTTTVGDTTSTSVPETTTTTEPVDSLDALGVIGCSNTNHATSGYLDASNSDLLVNTAWAGHTVDYWATTDAGWNEHYLPLRPEEGFDGVWLNLCERATSGLTLENAEIVLARIWEIDPGITVWVSPLNYYEGEECVVTNGNEVPDDGALIADTLAADYELIERGPDLGPLGETQLRRDLCHPNQDGISLLGSQLVDFFDGGGISN